MTAAFAVRDDQEGLPAGVHLHITGGDQDAQIRPAAIPRASAHPADAGCAGDGGEGLVLALGVAVDAEHYPLNLLGVDLRVLHSDVGGGG